VSTPEYNWTSDDIGTDVVSTRLPPEFLPERCALSYLAVDEHHPGTVRLAVVHPESFGTWMFPYGGLRIDDPVELRDSRTLGDLASALELLSENHRSEAVPAIERELSEYFDAFGVNDLGESAFTSYSLKYSKNANVWTAYVFRYHRSAKLLWRDGVRESRLLDTSVDLPSVVESGTLGGRSLEGNVLLFLRRLQRLS
jgi:hypothetical protein